MKQDEGRGPQENTELYRAAMNHLRLPEDFEQRTLELAKKRMEQAQEKQAVKDVWRAKPLPPSGGAGLFCPAAPAGGRRIPCFVFDTALLIDTGHGCRCHAI